MCPQMSPFVLICHITRYFTAFLIPVTLQPKGIGQANQPRRGQRSNIR